MFAIGCPFAGRNEAAAMAERISKKIRIFMAFSHKPKKAELFFVVFPPEKFSFIIYDKQVKSKYSQIRNG